MQAVSIYDKHDGGGDEEEPLLPLATMATLSAISDKPEKNGIDQAVVASVASPEVCDACMESRYSYSYQHQDETNHIPNESAHDKNNIQSMVELIGNVLEWYNFAIMGYFGDVIGDVFFPPSAASSPQNGNSNNSNNNNNNIALMESFAVFGSAFFMRPLGGILVGYLGDTYGRKTALQCSIVLMAIPTFIMGLAPTYQQVGAWSWVILMVCRLLQGISAGGQLMSSLVFTLEQHPATTWGYHGSLTMASANFGTWLCTVVGFALRNYLSKEQLYAYGWRIPFLSGILIIFCAIYLQLHCDETKKSAQPRQQQQQQQHQHASLPFVENPVCRAFAKKNRRQLFAACFIPMLWSGGFWFTFTWIPIYAMDMIDQPIPQAMAINSCALLLSVCILFPVAGIVSDQLGRRRTMTVGALAVGVLSPILVRMIGQERISNASADSGSGSGSHSLGLTLFLCQSITGLCLSFWGAPMMAWMVESFVDPEARLTSAEIGYNIGQAIAGGSTLATATWMYDQFGSNMPGFWLTGLALIALTGLWFVAPPTALQYDHDGQSMPPQQQGVNTVVVKPHVDPRLGSNERSSTTEADGLERNIS